MEKNNELDHLPSAYGTDRCRIFKKRDEKLAGWARHPNKEGADFFKAIQTLFITNWP
jgi:hypothetical protein